MTETHADLRFLVANLGPARLGFSVDRVVEVFALTAMAGLPWSPPWVLGAIYRAGRVVTVVDLAECLQLSDAEAPRVGVLVDHPEFAVAFAVSGVEVVEGRQTVQTTDIRFYLEDTETIVASLSTPQFDFHQVDLDRILNAVWEAF